MNPSANGASSTRPLLQVNDLTIEFHTRAGTIVPNHQVSLWVDEGKTLGIVGESGSGKSVLCRSILRLIPEALHHEESEILAKLRKGERIERYETTRLHRSGALLEISLTVSPIRDRAGNIIGAAKIAHDITARRHAERRARDETRSVETLNRVGRAVAAQMDLEHIVQVVTDAATEVTGAAFGAFFYNASAEHEDAYWLYTLSGAPREAFARFPHPRALIPFDFVKDDVLRESLALLAGDIRDNGFGNATNRASADLLLRHAPRAGQQPGARLSEPGEHLAGAARIARGLDRTVLPVQGPPGTGKTYVGARMILSLLVDGKRVGITGPPGAGKSTLVSALITHLRKAGRTIGVIAVDPTSPFTGGALLGDRVRMTSAHGDGGVFIRSMASRGHAGGLARASWEASVVFDAMGFDVVVVETVGVGQGEIEVVSVAHTTLLVCLPGSGDAVQASKAGLLEAADVWVLNKGDAPGADEAMRHLHEAMPSAAGRTCSSGAPVCSQTTAARPRLPVPSWGWSAGSTSAAATMAPRCKGTCC